MSEFSIIDVESDYHGGFWYQGKSGLTARQVADAIYEDLKDYVHPEPMELDKMSPKDRAFIKAFLQILAEKDPYQDLLEGPPLPR